MKVTVKVPATTANIGPGFDCLGLALSLWSEFTFEPAEKLTFKGCPKEYANEDNLVWQAFKKVYEKAGQPLPAGMLIRIKAEVPVARGLGSSSTCLTAGVLAANIFLGQPYTHEDLFQLLNEMEGHPDNVAPALFGGLRGSFVSDGVAKTVEFPTHPHWHFVAIIPNYEVSTHEARRLLKPQVPFADAVFNISHALATVKALETGDHELLRAACEDRLHEPLRATLIPEYQTLKDYALSHNMSAFFISGSGSTMIAMSKFSMFASDLSAWVKENYPDFTVLDLHAAEGAIVKVVR